MSDETPPDFHQPRLPLSWEAPSEDAAAPQLDPQAAEPAPEEAPAPKIAKLKKKADSPEDHDSDHAIFIMQPPSASETQTITAAPEVTDPDPLPVSDAVDVEEPDADDEVERESATVSISATEPLPPVVPEGAEAELEPEPTPEPLPEPEVVVVEDEEEGDIDDFVPALSVEDKDEEPEFAVDAEIDEEIDDVEEPEFEAELEPEIAVESPPESVPETEAAVEEAPEDGADLVGVEPAPKLALKKTPAVKSYPDTDANDPNVSRVTLETPEPLDPEPEVEPAAEAQEIAAEAVPSEPGETSVSPALLRITPDAPAATFFTESVGQTLKAAREQHDSTVQEVAQLTRIRNDFIDALEADNLTYLPAAPIYTKSYIKTLCRHYGIDAEPLVKAWEAAMAGAGLGQDDPAFEPSKVLHESEDEPESTVKDRAMSNVFKWVFVGMAAVIACVLGANIIMSKLDTGPSGGSPEPAGPMVEITNDALAPLNVPEILLQSELPVPD